MLVDTSEPPAFFGVTRELNSGWFTAMGPSAVHFPSLNKTLISWFAIGTAGYKNAIVAAYDHSTAMWSERYVAGNFLLADDDHGQLSICQDSSGYFYVFYGSHASPQHWSISTAPNDVTAWTQQPTISGAQTYPHPVFTNSNVYLFSRDDSTLSRRLLAVRTGTPSGGLMTFTVFKQLLDLGADTRVYQGEAILVGSDIHFVCMRTNADDQARRDIYYFVYKPSTLALENHDGSVSTATGSQPISLATANASYRIFTHGSGQGDIPSLCFDSSGDPHILFADDGGTGTYSLKHMKRSSGTWGSTTTLATLTDVVPGTTVGTGFVTTYTAIAGAAGTIEAWYINAAGDKLRRVRSASGVWSAEETIAFAGSHLLLGQTEVRDAAADFRIAFTEVGSFPSDDSTAVLAQRYAYGDSGFVRASIPVASVDANFASVSALFGFEHRDASVRFVNEADTALAATVQGNAQNDTAQSKFGAASLLLDGTGDFVTIPNNALFSVSNGNFTVECWVKRNATKLQCIAGKYPSSGSSEWKLLIDASNHLIFQGFSTSAAVVSITGTTTVTTNWHHVAATRSGTTWRVFLDGALEGSAIESATPNSNSQSLHIGRDASNTGRDFNGWVDEFRFTSGVARYTAAFTAPSAAFPRR